MTPFFFKEPELGPTCPFKPMAKFPHWELAQKTISLVVTLNQRLLGKEAPSSQPGWKKPSGKALRMQGASISSLALWRNGSSPEFPMCQKGGEEDCVLLVPCLGRAQGEHRVRTQPRGPGIQLGRSKRHKPGLSPGGQIHRTPSHDKGQWQEREDCGPLASTLAHLFVAAFAIRGQE